MKRLRNSLAAVLLLVAILFLLWFVFGKDIGETCDGRWNCFGFSAMCVSIQQPPYRFCSRTCEIHSDCPVNWSCQDMPLFKKKDVSLKMEKICVTQF